MYFIEELPFGQKTMFRVANQRGDSVQILPFAGACIHQLILDQKTVVSGASDLEEFTQNRAAYEGAQLCPFPGRIENGKYNFEGEEYSLPINDSAGNNALHGLITDKSFQMVDSRIHTDSAWISLGYEFPGEEGFPFPFYIENKFLLEKNTLTIETLIRNISKSSMPMAHGWHAYFEMEGSINDSKLQIPSQKKLELNKELIPTGNILRFHKAVDRMGETVLDDCFLIDTRKGTSITVWEDSTNRLEVWQESGSNGYNYLVIYTPGDRRRVAIEPMTCAPNAFNTGKGLINLSPLTEIRLRTGVVLRKVL